MSSGSKLGILQSNINGLCTTATIAKLDQLLDLANQHQVQISATQETKFKPLYNDYCILRKDRLSKGNGGLMFWLEI